jgi:hypothetical protein
VTPFTIHVHPGPVVGEFAAHQETSRGRVVITIDESVLADLPPKRRHLRLRQMVLGEVTRAVVKMLEKERRR